MPVSVGGLTSTQPSNGKKLVKYGFWDCWLQCTGFKRTTLPIAASLFILDCIIVSVVGLNWFNALMIAASYALLFSKTPAVIKIAGFSIANYLFLDLRRYIIGSILIVITAAIASRVFRDSA